MSNWQVNLTNVLYYTLCKFIFFSTSAEMGFTILAGVNGECRHEGRLSINRPMWWCYHAVMSSVSLPLSLSVPLSLLSLSSFVRLLALSLALSLSLFRSLFSLSARLSVCLCLASSVSLYSLSLYSSLSLSLSSLCSLSLCLCLCPLSVSLSPLCSSLSHLSPLFFFADNGTSRTDGIFALYQIMYQHRLPAFSYFRTTPCHP